MSWWTVAEDAAWLVSGLLLVWMLWDARQVARRYGEDLLLSSREGEE